jgi:hypothetical protein
MPASTAAITGIVTPATTASNARLPKNGARDQRRHGTQRRLQLLMRCCASIRCIMDAAAPPFSAIAVRADRC